MKRKQFTLTYFLLCLLTWLSASNQNCINRPKSTALQHKNDDNINIFELIAKIRGEMNAEKRRFRRAFDPKNFLGSNLFDSARKKSFTAEEINLLAARKAFEQQMVPLEYSPGLMSDHEINKIMRYFCYGHFLIGKRRNDSSNHIIKKAFYDTLGGFLQFYMVPIAKASFYAGLTKLETVLKVMAHYDKCRRLLNTNGNGWRQPDMNILNHISKGCIKPIKLQYNDLELSGETKFCSQLHLQSDADDGIFIDDSMLVDLPKIEMEDSDGYMSNIYLPYERKNTFNLRSQSSVHVVVKFYKVVIGCYKEKYMHPKVYNTKLREWITESVQPHLNDDMFYPGLGGILNLYETLRPVDKQRKLKSNKKPKIPSGERQKRSKETSIDDGKSRKNRCKTFKFLNLESKVGQCDLDSCHKYWLKDPTVVGHTTPKPEPQNKTEEKPKKKKWYNIFGFGSNKRSDEDSKDEDCDKDSDKDGSRSSEKSASNVKNKGSKVKDDDEDDDDDTSEDNDDDSTKDEDSRKSKKKNKHDDEKSDKDKKKEDKSKDDSDNKKKSRWGFLSKFSPGRLYKKGSWGLGFPRLKGLGFFSKLWEIFKFIFFLILIIIIIIILFKIFYLCCTVSAGPLKCFEYLLRALAGFAKLFIKVLCAMCACTTRMIGGENKNEPQDAASVVIVHRVEEKHGDGNGRSKNNKTSRDTREKKTKSVEYEPIPLETPDEELPKKSKDKQKSKSNKKDKKPPSPSSPPTEPPPPSEPQIDESTKKPKDKQKSKKERTSRSKEPAEISSPEPVVEAERNQEKTKEANNNEISDKKKKSKEKPNKKSKKSKDDETSSAEETDEDKAKKSKKSKEKEKEKQRKPPKSDAETQTEDTQKKPKRNKAKQKTNRRQKRRKKGDSDDETVDSSKRLRGGQSYVDQLTDWSSDNSDDDTSEEKASWKTFYEF